MISYAQFGKLRLAQFRPVSEVADLTNWEFDDAVWIGEAVGFSEWLRLESDPEVLRSLALDFAEFPSDIVKAVLATISLPLRTGMQFEELRAVLGQPVKEHRFVADRVTYQFALAEPPRYNVSCTVLEKRGLAYVTIMRPRTKRHTRTSGSRTGVSTAIAAGATGNRRQR